MKSESENNKKLNEFFKEEYPSLKNYVSSKVRSNIHYDPDDIIQDVALKLFSGSNRYTSINNVAAFVYRAVKNRIIDLMRTSKENKYHNEATKETRIIEFMEVLYGAADNNYPDHMKQELKKAIMELKPASRNIILAIDFEGYTYKEIHQDTGIPIGTLMSQRHRALAQLHKKINCFNSETENR